LLADFFGAAELSLTIARLLEVLGEPVRSLWTGVCTCGCGAMFEEASAADVAGVDSGVEAEETLLLSWLEA
jgi:hypothetical protein